MSNPTIIWDAILTGAHGDVLLSNNYQWGGSQFRLTDIDGWYGGVGVWGEQAQRVINHGLFERDAMRSGRVLTLKGSFLFEDEFTRQAAARYFSSLLWDGRQGALTVTTGDDLIQQAQVRLDGAIGIDLPDGSLALKLSVPLQAADPFIYAPPQRFQIFPAGEGSGLQYPLFKKMSQGITTGALTNTATAGGTAGAFEGMPSYTFTKQATTTIYSAPVTPGKVYTITTATYADVTGSGHAVRFNSNGATPSMKYIDLTQAGAIVVPTPLKDAPKRVTYVYEAKPGDTSITLTFFSNHANYSVTTAQQTFAVSIRESTSWVLDWGEGTPIGGSGSNEGNVTAYPTITVRGDWPSGFTISASGKRLTYSAPVHYSTPVVIDCKEGNVLVGGIDQTYKLTDRAWFAVEAGAFFQPTIRALGQSSGWAEIELSSTYI